ncbi:ABC transporter substrate-binding protein [Cohnella caldifontis]|uniref:ABC transporter substrate-binding protein n=1 Tax=Cohnella caldifontis TaxID=3027471 RepID=UPI0023EC5BB8|nr:ABC transporter substrate-binding protein [Cohnella sp. YIM B05605]
MKKHQHRFGFAATILLLVMGLALAGCGGGKSSGDSSASPSSASPSGSSSSPASSPDNGGGKSGAKTEILFWTPFSGPDGPFMKSIVDGYNQQSDRFTIKFQIQPNGDYYKLLDNAFGTKKNMPDFMIMHLDSIPTYVKKDLLLPMDDLAAKAGIQKADFADAAVNCGTIDGKWMGIPLDIHPLIMYYNKDLFQAAGIAAPPTNMQEFLDAAKKLTDASKGQWGYVMPTQWPQQFLFPSLVYQQGADLADASGKPTLNTPEAVKALEFERSLIFEHKVSPQKVAQDGEVKLFLQGKNAIQFNGPWMKDQWDKAKLNYGVAPIPVFFDQPGVFAGSHNFVVPKSQTDQAKLDGIGDFLKYVAGHSLDWAKSGQAVASKAVLASAEFQALTQQQTEVAKEFDYVHFAPPVPNWGSYTGELYNQINLVLLNNGDAKKALDEAQAKAEQAAAANK